jgi:DNA-binding MarR family transcriptional regulator
MADTPRWLTEDEQRAWQSYRRMTRQLEARLARDLLQTSNLSMQDYDVLSALSAAEGHRRTAKQLGGHLLWSPSRLSHHLDRMQKRGLVDREPSADGRGTDVTLTPAGLAAIKEAAPGHVDSVREVFIDRLTPRELTALRRLSTSVIKGLETGTADPER